MTTARDAETAIVDSMANPIGRFGTGVGKPTLQCGCLMPEFAPVSPADVAAIERPSCPKCRQRRMLLARLGAGPSGFSTASFECQKCGYVSTTALSGDPMTSDALGWLASELKPPT